MIAAAAVTRVSNLRRHHCGGASKYVGATCLIKWRQCRRRGIKAALATRQGCEEALKHAYRQASLSRARGA